MANRYFSYSFQVSNTKKIVIMFFILVVCATIGFLIFYTHKVSKENYKKLSYQKVLGMNEFDDNGCDKAYRLNYKKQTCGSICINVSKKNINYLTNLKKKMIQNGFTIKTIKDKTINSNNWNYFTTTNSGPSFSYYAINYGEKLYSIEVINQSSLLNKKINTKCNSDFNKFTSSLTMK